MPKKKRNIEQTQEVQVPETAPVADENAAAPKEENVTESAQTAEPAATQDVTAGQPVAKGKKTAKRKKVPVEKTDEGEEACKTADAAAAPVTAENAVPAEEPVENKTPAQEMTSPAEQSASEAPLLSAPENLPVEAQSQRAVKPAMPPVNLAMLGKERRNFWGRVLLLFAVGVVLGLSVFIFVYRPTLYSVRTHSIRFLYNAEANTTQVLYDGAVCDTVLTGECTGSMYDTTGSICAAEIGGKLYAIQGDEIEEISPTVQDFLLAQNGAVLVYRNDEDQLHYVKLWGKSERYTVSRDCRSNAYALSPDGEALFYTYVETLSETELKTHAAVFTLSGDKPYFPGTTGIIPVAIADDCKHVFYFDAKGDFYYMNKESEISLCRRYDENMKIFFDREFEEVLIKDEKGTMLWQDGEETMLPQLKGAETLTLLPNHRVERRVLPSASQWLVSSFDKNYYLKRGGDTDGVRLAYLKGDEVSEVSFLSETESFPVVTDKGVYYLERVESKDGVRKHLYLCPIGKTVAVQLSWDVEEYCVNNEGSRILHKDHQGWLYASRVSNNHLDSEFISDYVDGGLQHSSAKDMFYYYVGEELFASENGEKPEKAISSEIDGFFLDAHTGIFVDEAEDGTYTVYTRHRTRKKLVQVATGIARIH